MRVEFTKYDLEKVMSVADTEEAYKVLFEDWTETEVSKEYQELEGLILEGQESGIQITREEDGTYYWAV